MTKERAIEIIVEHALEMAKKNKEKWAKIGRSVNEFHKGDIAYCSDWGYVEVVTEPNDGWTRVEAAWNGLPMQKEVHLQTITLVTPFQLRFDWEP